jgi:hypothetical protein
LFFGLSHPASAAHVNEAAYAKAYKISKQFTDMKIWSWDQHGQRYQREGVCMMKYGIRYNSAF